MPPVSSDAATFRAGGPAVPSQRGPRSVRRNGRLRAERKSLFCVVPSELAAELHDALREHWSDDPSVTVVVERRVTPAPRALTVAERRATALVAPPPRLPAFARPHAAQLLFVERVQATSGDAEDADTRGLILRAQTGDMDAFGSLYLRYFDRVYAYARAALRDPHEAEDVTQQVFVNVMKALPRYEVRSDTPFRLWLFRITRNAVLRALTHSRRVDIEDPTQLDRRLENPSPESRSSLDWLSDHDLAQLVERLPLAQRQVILLRYVFEFPTDEIASALGRSPLAIRMLEHRAMRALEARLAAFRSKPARSDHAPARSNHSPIVARVRTRPVTTNRRIALEPISRALDWRMLRPAAHWQR
jgi:RNA polymerase sigma-70 factor (ECF subfamily)